MKAAVVVGANDIRIQDIPEPTCGPGMVKVAVAYCGVCGSDVPRVLKGACHSFPQVLGHEFSGVVSAVGDGVTGLSVDNHVVGVPLVPCHACEDCTNGNFSLCKQYSFVGSRQQGAMADFVVVPAENVVRLDPSVPLEHAALIEPSTVALHGVLRQGFNPKACDTVAIIGLGPIALFALQWCKILGAKNVVVIGRHRGRLSVAERYGASHVFSTLDADCAEQVVSVVGKRGCAYVFDVVGTEETVKLGLKLVSNKGVLCMIGTPTESMSFTVKEWELINRKEMTLTGSWMSYSSPWPGDEWRKTVKCLADRSLAVCDELISDVVPLEKIKSVFDRFENDRASIKGRVILKIR